MFGFMTPRERGILLIGPMILVGIILFLGWQTNLWYAEAQKEEQLKNQWQQNYIALNDSVQQFAEEQKKLTAAVASLTQLQNTQRQDLKNALKQNQDWANAPLPDAISRLLNSAESH